MVFVLWIGYKLREKRRSVAKVAFVGSDDDGLSFSNSYYCLYGNEWRYGFQRWRISTVDIFNHNTDFTVTISQSCFMVNVRRRQVGGG